MGDLSEHAEDSPASLMKSPFKTIFHQKLLYQLDEHSLPGGLDNECAQQSSRVSPMNDFFKTTSEVIPSAHRLCCQGDLNSKYAQVFPKVTDEQPFQEHLPSKTALFTSRSDSWRN